jgi:alpha-tubulin suppressor-like RCC1 family protein
MPVDWSTATTRKQSFSEQIKEIRGADPIPENQNTAVFAAPSSVCVRAFSLALDEKGLLVVHGSEIHGRQPYRKGRSSQPLVK